MTNEDCGYDKEVENLGARIEELENEIMALEDELSSKVCEEQVEEAEQELKDFKYNLLVPVFESLGAQHADILMALDAHDPVGALRALVKN